MKQQKKGLLALARRAVCRVALVAVVLPIGFSPVAAIAQVSEPQVSEPLPTLAPQKMRVGTKEIVPFVFLDEQVPYGYSIEVWAQIANDFNIETEWVQYDTVSEMLDGVKSGEVDAAIAGISITAQREAQGLDFSYPFYRSGLQLMARSPDATPIRSALSNMFSWRIWRPLLLVMGTSAGVGAIIWALEHKHNDNFSSNPINGIGQGMWFSVVTLGTFGYGDVTPTKLPARIVACLWMGASFFIVADFIAGLTVNQMADMSLSFEDLRGEPVGALEGTTGEEYVRSQPVDLVEFATLDEMVAALEDDDVDAVVHDYPTLKYIANNDPNEFEIAGNLLTIEGYGIAFAEGADITELFNQEILVLQERGYLQLLRQKWFGENPADL